MQWELILPIFLGVLCIVVAFVFPVWFPSQESNFCEDINEWCNCWNGKMMCDLNVAYECDYLCEEVKEK